MENCGYQELCNIPLIIRAPGITWPGTVTHGLVNSVDILPTLLELTEQKRPDTLQGYSFARLLRKPGSDFRDQIFIHWGPQSIVSFDGEWKYGFHANAEVDELYNLRKEPGELKNLAKNKIYSEYDKVIR